MTSKDYDLMIHICQYALRKGHDLNSTQVAEIGNLVDKLHKERYSKGKKYVVVRSKKMGKRAGV
jgi:hypothetical protein